ncbi:hypothetical protein [Brevundimonas sp.]|uniref:hypothetical protein n=1 Tax=Brevundimonas sp. TaxID=1871086 RepID=UPI0028A1A016|nr:hypothetical protein [Brevundimonas sp.]
MIRSHPIYVGVALALSACSESGSSEPDAAARLAASEMLTQRVSPSAIRLADDTCIDASRLPKPWAQEPGASPNIIKIAAAGEAIHVAPFDREDRATSFDDEPHDGKVRVGLSRGPWDNGAHSSLAMMEQRVAEGLLKRTSLWGEKSDLSAYSGVGDPKYVNRQDTIRCRDYSASISCHLLTPDRQVRFGVRVDASDRSRLPEVLNIIATAVDATRGPCPSSAVKATS